MGSGPSKPKFKDFNVNTIEEAVENIVPYLEDTKARNQVIYFDGWGGLGASAVLNSIAEHPPPSLRNKFHNIIHINCSRWKNRRALQRAIAEKLRLPQHVMAIFDRQDEEEDLAGVDEGSRAEIADVGIEIYRALQGQSSLVVFHNGSDSMVDFNDLGIPRAAADPWSNILRKVLWTFRGRLHAMKGRDEVADHLKPDKQQAKGTETVDTSYLYFGSLFSGSSDLSYRLEILREEAKEIAQYTNKHIVTWKIAEVCCRYLLSLNSKVVPGLDFNWATHASNYWVCDGILQELQRHEAWEVATALHEELQLEGHSSYRLPYPGGDTASWIVATNTSEGIAPTIQPETTSFFLEIERKDRQLVVVVPLPKNMFQTSEQLHVLKLCHCIFSFSSPPFLLCRNLRFLGLDSCMDQPHEPEEINDEEEDKGKDVRTMEFFQCLWVLDIFCTDWELTLSPNILEKMTTNLREVNVKRGRIWHSNLAWRRLTNIHKLRMIELTCPWETGSMDFFTVMVKLELLDLSGNSTIQVLPSLSGAIGLKTLVLDGCIGLEHIGPESLPQSLETFSFDTGLDNSFDTGVDDKAKITCISLADCARLVNFRLRGSVQNLEELNLSNTSVKALDLKDEVVQVPCLQRIILLGCERLHVILWPANGMPKLMVLCIDTRGEVARSKTAHDIFMGKEREEGFRAFIAVSDMNYLQSFVLSSANKFCWNTDLRYNLNLCLSSTSKDVGQNNMEKMGPRQKLVIIPKTHPTYSDANIVDKATLDHDGSSARQFQPLDRHLEIGEGISNSNVVTVHGIRAVILLMNRVYSLHVHDNSSIRTVIPESMMCVEVEMKNKIYWSCLRWCHVERCPNLDTVFATNYDTICFTELETFWAADLLVTLCIWTKGSTVNSVDTKSFAKLRAIHLYLCPRLTFVLPLSWFYTLSSLDTLHIVYCGDLRQVFPVEEKFVNKISTDHPRGVLEFPKLRHIYLHELPKLHQICEANMFAPKLKVISVRGCWSLTRLPATTDRPDDRPVVGCERDWWEKLQWDGKKSGHDPSLFEPRHSKYYKKTMVRHAVLR